MKQQFLIFTDLDGTLLDHHTYRFDAAQPMLETLEKLAIPVIPITSKTRAELLALRVALNNQHPFVTENGAAVFIPKGYFSTQPEETENVGDFWVRSFSPVRLFWVQLLESLAHSFRGDFTYFSKMGEASIVQHTGLSPDAAALANDREFSEPVLWTGSEAKKTEFKTMLAEHGMWVIEGGRFLHISNGSDKGKALTWLTQTYQQQWPDRAITTVALGDSHNDLAMLEACDQPIIIQSPTKHRPRLTSNSSVINSRLPGPEGWSESLERYLKVGMT